MNDDTQRFASEQVGSDPSVPLVVDLDGTLFRGDTLHEVAFETIFRAPLSLPGALLALVRGGKAALKAAISPRFADRAVTLPLREEVLELARRRKEAGGKVILATGAHASVARAAAARVGLFDEVLSTGDLDGNFVGERKRDELVRRFGAGGFDYVGDSRTDLPVWAAARRAFSVGRAARRELTAGGRAVEGLASPEKPPKAWKSLRPHQWVKNLLVFVPAAAGHRFSEPGSLAATATAFAAFSCAASFVYLVNDLSDRDADRAHPKKRRRPIAWGALGPLHATAVAVGLLVVLSALLSFLPWQAGAAIATYLVVNFAYSLHFKRRLLVDVFLLAWMYVWRIVTGGFAAGIELTPWLLGFSGFTFLSLALAKRYAEVVRLAERGQETAKGRAWRFEDAPALLAAGMASGFGGAVVLALYVNGASFARLYRNPTLAMLLAPLFLYWILRLWLQAVRQELHEDPVVFAAKDLVSWAVVVLAVAILGAAMF